MTSKVVDSCAVESPPTQTSNVEESVTQSRTAAFQYRRSSGPDEELDRARLPCRERDPAEPLELADRTRREPCRWWM